jgi:hypothetical protein
VEGIEGMSVFQKGDGKWYFQLERTYNPETQKYDLPIEFGGYDDKEKAECDEAQAEATMC